MKEDYLQFIWSQSRIPWPHVSLTTGEKIIVSKVGDHNTLNSGPDFKNAVVQFDGLEFHGSIELHVNSSDWMRHKHHLDPAYNNVILHVVLNHDQPIQLCGTMLPTIELKRHIDKDHYHAYKRLLRHPQFPCAKKLNELNSIYFESMKSKALYQKLHDKTKTFGSHESGEVLYQLTCQAFGMGINAQNFGSIAIEVPWQELKLVDSEMRSNLILAYAGLMMNNKTDQPTWHFRGTRPSNFPLARIAQLAKLVSKVDFDNISQRVLSTEGFKAVIQSLTTLMNNDKKKLFSSSFITHLQINAFVPYMFWRNGQDNFIESRIKTDFEAVLEKIKPEKNRITRLWISIGIIPKNAYDSQALLALHRNYCGFKKCLSCEVGCKILKA